MRSKMNLCSVYDNLVLSKFAHVSRRIPLPKGEGGTKGPVEGCRDSSLHPSPAASRHPLPFGRGIRSTTLLTTVISSGVHETSSKTHSRHPRRRRLISARDIRTSGRLQGRSSRRIRSWNEY